MQGKLERSHVGTGSLEGRGNVATSQHRIPEIGVTDGFLGAEPIRPGVIKGHRAVLHVVVAIDPEGGQAIDLRLGEVAELFPLRFHAGRFVYLSPLDDHITTPLTHLIVQLGLHQNSHQFGRPTTAVLLGR